MLSDSISVVRQAATPVPPNTATTTATLSNTAGLPPSFQMLSYLVGMSETPHLSGAASHPTYFADNLTLSAPRALCLRAESTP